MNSLAFSQARERDTQDKAGTVQAAVENMLLGSRFFKWAALANETKHSGHLGSARTIRSKHTAYITRKRLPNCTKKVHHHVRRKKQNRPGL